MEALTSRPHPTTSPTLKRSAGGILLVLFFVPSIIFRLRRRRNDVRGGVWRVAEPVAVGLPVAGSDEDEPTSTKSSSVPLVWLIDGVVQHLRFSLCQSSLPLSPIHTSHSLFPASPISVNPGHSYRLVSQLLYRVILLSLASSAAYARMTTSSQLSFFLSRRTRGSEKYVLRCFG